MDCHQKVIQFNNIHKKIQINVHFWEKKINLIMYIVESILRINFKYFHLEKYQ
jgi:hypothetical protein